MGGPAFLNFTKPKRPNAHAFLPAARATAEQGANAGEVSPAAALLERKNLLKPAAPKILQPVSRRAPK